MPAPGEELDYDVCVATLPTEELCGNLLITYRLQHDHEQRQKGPVGLLAHGEVGPPRLNRDKERNQCPYQGGRIELHLRPGQYEAAETQQDLCNCQAENDREDDRKIGKGVHRYGKKAGHRLGIFPLYRHSLQKTKRQPGNREKDRIDLEYLLRSGACGS